MNLLLSSLHHTLLPIREAIKGYLLAYIIEYMTGKWTLLIQFEEKSCWKFYSCSNHIPFLAPLTRRSAQRSWWYYWFVRRPSSVVVRRRPSSVNFCFKSLLLLQFLFDNSEFFTGETRHIVPPCNKAGISNFCLEFQKLQKFQISWKRYSSYSSYSKILNFLLEKLDI